MLILPVLLLVAGVAGTVSAVADHDWNTTVPLDEYVWLDDGFYSWEYMTNYTYPGVTVYMLNMTSQKWFDESFSDRPVWWHYMGVAVPNEVRYPDAGFLWIGERSNTNSPPGPLEEYNLAMSIFSLDVGMVSAYVLQVPNQPIIFVDDPEQKPRREDDQIAWTWREFLEVSPDMPEMLSRFPMTKAAVKAMDTVNTVAKEQAPDTDVTRFFVSGGSKRGWTAWTVAAVDRRVEVAIPIVMSLLNMRDLLVNHHWRCLGGWTYAFRPYVEQNFTQNLDNPNLELLESHVNPYSYRSRLDMPKIHIGATGDQFFLMDEATAWYKDMTQPMYFWYGDNAEHGMSPHYLRVMEMWGAAVLTQLNGEPWPQLSWEHELTETGGAITLWTDPPPLNLTAWYSTSLDDGRRDWRLKQYINGSSVDHPVEFLSSDDILDLGDGVYRFELDEEPGRWRAFYLEGVWMAPESHRFRFATTPLVIPDTYPFLPCEGEECHGELL